MYCMAGQSSEEEMYNNESAGPALEEFLNLLGERVRLKGFTKYRAQLDTKSTCTLIRTLNLKHYPQLQAKNSLHFRNCFQVNKDRICNDACQKNSDRAPPPLQKHLQYFFFVFHHKLVLIHCIS